MDAEQDNDLEPSLPLLAHVRTLCQDPHHTQGDFDHADDEVGDEEEDEEDDGGDPDDEKRAPLCVCENQHGDDAPTLPFDYFDAYLLNPIQGGPFGRF